MEEAIKKAIEQKKIIEGMDTVQASLAGGAYFFRVIADSKVWDKDIDPNIVIKAQVQKPDNSKIWMTFQNTTQFDTKKPQTFQVEFQRGRVVKITRGKEC